MNPRTRTRVAVSPTGSQSAAKIHELKQPTIVHRAKRTTRPGTAGEWLEQSAFVESPKVRVEESRTGVRRGGKAPPRRGKGRGGGDKFFAPVYLDQKSKQTNIHHVNLTTSLIHKPAVNLPPSPINMDYKLVQVGNSSQLDGFKKMYKKTKIQLNVPTQYVGGAGIHSRNRLRDQTFAGLSRKGIHLPHLYADHTDPNTGEAKLNLTASRSLFNRDQIKDALRQMYTKASEVSSPVIPISFDDWLKDIVMPAGAENRYGLPVGKIECLFKVLNRNTASDCHLSVYLCTPKKRLKAVQHPANTWVNFWKGNSDMTAAEASVLMNNDYRYNPVLQADYQIMGTAGPGDTVNPNTNPISIYTNRAQVLTASTEVSLDSSPYLSQEFRNSWEVVTVHKIKLLPQQSLNYKFEFEFSKVLDLKSYFSDGSLTSEKTYFYPEESVYPLFCFYGSETAAESKALQENVNYPDPVPKIRNLAQESTSLRTAPTCIVSEMEASMELYLKEPPMYTMGGQTAHPLLQRDGLDMLMENLTSQTRYIIPADDPQRGITSTYYYCNENITDFFDKPSWVQQNFPSGIEYASTIVELNTKAAGNVVPTNANPPTSALRWGNSEMINYNTVETVSRTQIVRTQSDMLPE